MIQAETIPQTVPQIVTFDEFVVWYPENSIHRYELHNGVIIEMPLGTGDRSNVTGFITIKLGVEIDRRELPYSIPGQCLLKPRWRVSS
jgi:Uma2 family endonuclease